MGLGQPLPGMYSVELGERKGNAEEDEEYQLQQEEKKRRKRRSKLNLTASYHSCNGECNHGLSPPPPKAHQTPVNHKPKSWFQKYAELSLVECEAVNREVNAVPSTNQDTNYETIAVTVDSGAYNTVGPPKVGTHFEVKPTEASASGRHYRAANGSVIRNYGQRVVTGRTNEGTLVSMPIQVADVGKVLGSVREMVHHGNRVVFDMDSNGRSISYIECKANGIKTAIHERNGTFQFDIRVPKGKGGGVEEVRGGNGEVTKEGFPRQGTLMADLFH